jgi:hypothetical protein
MRHLLTAMLLCSGLLGTVPPMVQAQTCATQCAQPLLQFRPGQRIKVQLTNRTGSVLLVENTLGAQPLAVRPGQTLQFYRGGATDPNFSVAFWEETETPLRAKLAQAGDTLKIDLSFAPRRGIADRAVYVRNDGQVETL